MKPRLKQLRFILVPAGSRRERLYHSLRVALLTLKESGLGTFVAQLPWWFRTFIQDGGSGKAGSARQDNYARWIKKNEPGRRELAAQRKSSPLFSYRPLVTVLTPVYNVDPRVLKETIGSVLAQTYPGWELCLVNGGSTHDGIRQMLDEWAQREPRIYVRHLEKNLGISANSNEALRMAQGEFVFLLDHDDLLAPNALYEVICSLNENPTADIIYFDEDKISADGKHRNAPWFKPAAWSPDLLLSTNYFMHSVIRRELLESAGGFNPQMDGAQDWDLALRLTEMTQRAVHIPKIFYHWRQLPGSASRDANAKPWAFEAQKRCIEAHLVRLGVAQPQVAFPSLGLVHILWPLSGHKVSIIIPTKDKLELLQPCVESILAKTTYLNYEIIIVDNGSTDAGVLAYYQSLDGDPRLKVVFYPHPFNYHTINNFGTQQASGEIFVFLNNDTVVLEPSWLEELAGWAERPEIGVVGAKLVRPDGSLQHAGIIMGLAGHGSHVFEGAAENTYGLFGSTEWYRNYQAVTGACLTIRREVFEALGGFDEVFQVGYGDIDLCLRAQRAGYRVVYTPFARLLHHEGGSRGLSLPPADVLRASVQMYPVIQAGDGYFNPNLSRSSRLPALRWPGEKTSEAYLLKIMYDFDLLGREDPGASDPQRWKTRLGCGPHPALSVEQGKPRLLVVTHELSWSGAPIILWKVIQYLTQHGYQATVLSPFDGPLHEKYLAGGIQVFILPSLLEDARIILDYLDGHDLVFVNTILGFRTVQAARAFQKRCIWWVHESGFGQQWAGASPTVAKALAVADAVVFPSRATAGLYARFSNGHNYFPIHSGLEVNVEADSQRICNVNELDEPDILHIAQVASIETRKGQDILLKALAELPPEISKKIKCYLIGRILSKSEPGYCRKISRLANAANNVQILGDIPAERVWGYLEQVDVFVLPSRDEALPLSLLEAMAFGKAVVASRVGGVPEIIQHGENGLLIDNEDHRALAEHLLRLYQDRAFARQLGSAAKQTFEEHFAFEHFAKKMLGLVDRFIQ